MRQRNVSGSPLQIPDIPAYVLQGEEIDWGEPLAGFEPVDPEADTESGGEPDAKPVPVKAKPAGSTTATPAPPPVEPSASTVDGEGSN